MNESRRAARVILVDDHQLVRDAIASMLERSAGVEIVGRLDRADDVVDVVRRTEPDLVLFDVEMPGRSAFDAARMVRATCPTAKVAFLSAYPHTRFVEEAESLGAAAFLRKSDPPERIVEAIRRVLDGARVLDSARTGVPHGTLTSRELEVLKYIAQGMTTKEMASTMCLSPRTVERHVERLMECLGIHDRLKLALYAFREGLAEPVRPGVGPQAQAQAQAQQAPRPATAAR